MVKDVGLVYLLVSGGYQPVVWTAFIEKTFLFPWIFVYFLVEDYL